MRLANQIEAILYLKGKPLTLADLAESAGCSRDEIEVATIELMADYAHRDSALEVVETPAGYTLQLRGTFQTLIDKLVPPEIGTGALRTLAAIAIKGSIAQSDLVELRGSGAYQHVQELVELGFVRKRRQSGNRSSLLQVTDKFHRTYELNEKIAMLLPIANRTAIAGSIEPAPPSIEAISPPELNLELNLEPNPEPNPEPNLVATV